MRLIDADVLIKRLHETAFKDGDDRQIVYNAIDGTPSIDSNDMVVDSNGMVVDELKAHIEYLKGKNENLKGQIRALAFAVRCNGVSGNEVKYEAD